MIKKSFALLTMGIFCAGCGDQSLSITAYRENREGVKLLKAENFSGSAERFTEALSASPYLSEIHLNFGLSLRGMQKPDEASKSYQNAEQLAKDGLSLFAARFNLAENAGKARKIDEALAWYQKALEVAPGSEEVKTNIELLLNGQGGGGEGDQQQDKPQEGQGDQKKDPESGKDQDQKKDGKGEGQDQKDQEKDKDGNEKPKDYQGGSGKYKPREFKGELSEADVKKILGEIRQQEQKIRSEFSRKEAKERPRDKDW
jgi:tetratricopeptide (TPR) repeat protein